MTQKVQAGRQAGLGKGSGTGSGSKLASGSGSGGLKVGTCRSNGKGCTEATNTGGSKERNSLETATRPKRLQRGFVIL